MGNCVEQADMIVRPQKLYEKGDSPATSLEDILCLEIRKSNFYRIKNEEYKESR